MSSILSPSAKVTSVGAAVVLVSVVVVVVVIEASFASFWQPVIASTASATSQRPELNLSMYDTPFVRCAGIGAGENERRTLAYPGGGFKMEPAQRDRLLRPAPGLVGMTQAEQGDREIVHRIRVARIAQRAPVVARRDLPV